LQQQRPDEQIVVGVKEPVDAGTEALAVTTLAGTTANVVVVVAAATAAAAPSSH
jgi:hypothetical protein